ncbi:MAG: trigger factor [Gammaproteobacteria bacterium]|nr:trigger factor [Gammaproteobacteria bacterium]
MRISVETTGGLERKLNVAVPAESFESQVQERLKDTAKQVRLPGFRPGRVPMKEVRRRFGTRVRADVASDVIDRSFTDAVIQESLTPVGQPRVDIVNLAPGADFEYSATFEVLPTFQVADLSGMEVVRLEAEITEADIDQMVEDLQKRATIWEEAERPCADGDRITYRAQMPSQARKADDDGWTTERNFVLGEDAVPLGDTLRGLSAGEQAWLDLEGASAGDSEAADEPDGATTDATGEAAAADTSSAALPDGGNEPVEAEPVEETPAPDEGAAAGGAVPADDTGTEQKAGWMLELTLVEQGRLPELDAEFFTGYGVEDGTEESFRALVRQNMQARLDEAVRQHLRNSVMDTLRTGHDFPLPNPMVEDTIAAQRERYQGFGIDPAQIPQEVLTKSAEAIVRTQLVVRRIVEDEELTVDPTRLRERIDQYASSFDDPDALVQYIYSDDQRLDRFEAQVLEEQVVELVAERAQSRTEQLSYMEALQRASEGDAPADEDVGEVPAEPDQAAAEARGEASEEEPGEEAPASEPESESDENG